MNIQRDLKFFLLFIVGFFVIATPVMFGSAYNLITMCDKAKTWPSTNGTVVHVDVVAPSSSSRSGNTYSVKVFYDYTVDGAPYTSSQGEFGDLPPTPGSIFIGSISPQNKDDLVARYPKGQTVPVYYNPLKPSESLIDREVTSSGLSSVYYFAALDLIVLTVAILSLVKVGGSKN